jgi:Ras-related protein Rab-7A
LFYRFATGKFNGIRRPTVGSDFLSKKVSIHDIDVTVQVWDTAGQERFNQGTIGAAFFRGAHGALLVYDVNNEKSIEQIEQWRDECLQRKETNFDFFPIVVIGNKIDLRDATPEDQRVDQSHILSWCRENAYGHIETSAKDGYGVEAAMMAIVGLALECQRSANGTRNGIMNPNTGTGGAGDEGKIRLSEKYEPKKSGCC